MITPEIAFVIPITPPLLNVFFFSTYADVSQNGARICLVRYSQNWAEGLNNFDSFNSKEEALQAVNEIKFYGKGADIDAALDEG